MKPVLSSTSSPELLASDGVVGKPAIDGKLVASLASVYVIWSSTYLAMRIVVHELPPLLSAAIRFAVAGAVMMIYALRRGATLPTWRDWARVAPVGVLLFVGGNGFVSIASQSIVSGGTAVVCALMPLWVGVLGAATGVRPTAREWMSLVVGCVGVLVLLGGPSLAGEPVHIVLLILSPMLWAAGSLISRGSKDVGGTHAPLVGPAMQMLTGGAILTALGLL